MEVDSQEEQDAILGEIRSRGWDGDTHFGFWIGLTDIFHDGTWVWDHLGKPLAFSAWAPGEPNNWGGLQHCAAIKVSEYGARRMGAWDDVGCEVVEISYRSDGETLGHICEAAGKKML